MQTMIPPIFHLPDIPQHWVQFEVSCIISAHFLCKCKGLVNSKIIKGFCLLVCLSNWKLFFVWFGFFLCHIQGYSWLCSIITPGGARGHMGFGDWTWAGYLQGKHPMLLLGLDQKSLRRTLHATLGFVKVLLVIMNTPLACRGRNKLSLEITASDILKTRRPFTKLASLYAGGEKLYSSSAPWVCKKPLWRA